MVGNSDSIGYKQVNKTWAAGLYIRLSQEDENNTHNRRESNSISSQKILLNEFIEEKNDIIIFDTYIDDGFTGTDFNRPSFQRMLEDIKKGNINCIIVKDLSRLGRNYIEVGNYIEKIFPIYNVRFIAINDMIDSFLDPLSVNNIVVPFKNLINDEYARDTSIKIRSALDGKRRKGLFVGAFATYGYIKNPKNSNELIVDEVAAKVVRKIFEWYTIDGFGKLAICHKLNALGVLNPTGHKKLELNQNYNNSMVEDGQYLWNPSTVRNILKNEIYIGNMVQGKRKTRSYKLHKVECVEEKNWIKVENTHTPIINKEIFRKAQKLNNEGLKTSKTTKQLSIFAGVVKCADCKKAMNKKSSTNKNGKKYEYYICSTYRKKSHLLCTKHTIREEKLNEAILQAINWNIQKYANNIKTSKIENTKQDIVKEKERDDLENFIKKKKREREKKYNYKKNLYEDWKNRRYNKRRI